jgi:outer membrane protein assembly factor BamB
MIPADNTREDGMHRRWLRRIAGPALTAGLLSVATVPAWSEASGNWPSFRGPRAAGVAEGHPLPTAWDLESGKGLLWKVSIPGLAHSSPVIWGDRICVTSAVRQGGEQSLKVGLYGDIEPVADEGSHEWRVTCADKRTGEVLWRQVAHAGVPRTQRHTKSTHANSTPATDGRHLVAFFGSEGLHAFDLEGNPLWRKDFGVLSSGFFVAPTAVWGFASSPVIHEGKVVVQVDVLEDDFIAAFDVKDGTEIWRTPRDEVPTWSSPTIYTSGESTRIAVNGWQQAGGYDFGTGEEIWRFTGGGDIPVPTPVVAHDLIFITNSHGDSNPIFAIRTSAKGDISLAAGATTNDHIAWGQWRDGAYMPTPIVYGDLLYVLRDNGTFFCYDARTGEERYKVRLGKGNTGFSASPVAGDGKIFLSSEMGDVYVIASGPEFEQLAVNSTGEVTMATPAISQGVLYFRTRQHLIAVGTSAD